MAEQIVEAPMLGKVIRVHVSVGDSVTDTTTVCDIEAMKMEIPIEAPVRGTVKTVHVTAGQEVQGGDPLVTIEH